MQSLIAHSIYEYIWFLNAFHGSLITNLVPLVPNSCINVLDRDTLIIMVDINISLTILIKSVNFRCILQNHEP